MLWMGRQVRLAAQSRFLGVGKAPAKGIFRREDFLHMSCNS